MDYDQLQSALGLDGKEIIVKLIKPIRTAQKGIEDVYKTGRVAGFKPGIYGGGHYGKHGRSYDSTRRHWIKKPKVLVVYNIFTYGKSEHSDWVDVDNCAFSFKPTWSEPKVEKRQ
jgi:phosphoribosylaminoimidazole (AIR) synthetase